MDPFLQLLKALCSAHPTRAKWVFVPTHAIGRTLGDRLVLEGTDWANLRFVTPLDIALRMSAPFLVERDIDTDPVWQRAFFTSIPVVELGDRRLELVTSAAKLRRLLADRLPGPMVPDHVTALDAFPRTAGGRLDRAAREGRNPSTGESKLYGEFLINAQGEDVVAGIRTPQPIVELEKVMPKAYKQLREITPATLVTMAPTDEWKLSFRGIGNAVNKLDKANKVIADHESAAKAAGAKLGADKGAEVSIVRWNPDGPSWMEKKQFASGVALEMGLKRPKTQNKDGNAHTPSLSLEKIDQIDGDWLFLSTLTSDGEKALKDVQSKPAYKELGAVKKKHVVTVNGSVWSTRGGPLASGVVLKDITKALSKS